MGVIFVFGNELVDEDSNAIKISSMLKGKFDFIHTNRPESLLNTNEETIILDVAKGIDKVVIITDIDKFKSNNIVSLHDFDLGFFLKVIKKINPKRKFKIICVPCMGDPKEYVDDVAMFLSKTIKKR